MIFVIVVVVVDVVMGPETINGFFCCRAADFILNK